MKTQTKILSLTAITFFLAMSPKLYADEAAQTQNGAKKEVTEVQQDRLKLRADNDEIRELHKKIKGEMVQYIKDRNTLGKNSPQVQQELQQVKADKSAMKVLREKREADHKELKQGKKERRANRKKVREQKEEHSEQNAKG